MKKLMLLIPVFILLSSFTVKEIHTKPAPISTVATVPLPALTSLEKLATLKIKEIEKLTGRKLKLKEKIALKIYQLKLKKELKAKEKGETKSKGQTAFILGLVGIGVLLIPYVSIAAIPLAILAIVIGSKAKKENPKDGKAQTGIILGIVTLGLIVLAILLVLAILAADGWWV